MALSLGTNGVRAKFDELNPSTAADFAFAFSLFVKKHSKSKRKKVALARDMRKTSPCLFDASASGLCEGGVDVLDIGLLPSPVAEWAARKLNADGLIIVTASHNPPEYNALKFVDKEGVAISRERGAKFNKFLNKPHKPVLKWKEIGKIEKIPNILQEYENSVISNIDKKLLLRKPKLKIIADPGNGTTTLIAPKLLRSLGADVILINEKLDGSFPGRPSEPNEQNLQDLIEKVKEEKADFGVGWDGDGDRVTFVDEKGNWINGDKAVAISAQYALMHEKNAKQKCVVTTSATSKCVEDVALSYGAKIIYTDVGAPYLAEKMHKLRKEAVCGGEEVGGVIWPSFSLAKDGIFAACKLMEMACQKPLSKWADSLPQYFNSKTKVKTEGKKKLQAIQKLKKQIKGKKEGKLMHLTNGFRLNLKDCWVLVRASGTEEYIRIFAESRCREEANALMNKYKRLVQKCLR
ncbi:MAG: phosphoglucosamine mutase [Candidatus Micrarchaeota archaeon]